MRRIKFIVAALTICAVCVCAGCGRKAPPVYNKAETDNLTGQYNPDNNFYC